MKYKKLYVISTPMDISIPRQIFPIKVELPEDVHGYLPVFTNKKKAQKFAKEHNVEFMVFDTEYRTLEPGDCL